MQSQQQQSPRWYPPHHFVFLPVMLGLVIWAGLKVYAAGADRDLWIAALAGFVMLTFYGVMGRQHYALGNQDRIVRLEMRLRYYRLTGKAFEPLESGLSFGQIAALRFAPDAELEALVERTISERMSAGEIKKNIRQWLPDMMRL